MDSVYEDLRKKYVNPLVATHGAPDMTWGANGPEVIHGDIFVAGKISVNGKVTLVPKTRKSILIVATEIAFLPTAEVSTAADELAIFADIGSGVMWWTSTRGARGDTPPDVIEVPPSMTGHGASGAPGGDGRNAKPHHGSTPGGPGGKGGEGRTGLAGYSGASGGSGKQGGNIKCWIKTYSPSTIVIATAAGGQGGRGANGGPGGDGQEGGPGGGGGRGGRVGWGHSASEGGPGGNGGAGGPGGPGGDGGYGGGGGRGGNIQALTYLPNNDPAQAKPPIAWQLDVAGGVGSAGGVGGAGGSGGKGGVRGSGGVGGNGDLLGRRGVPGTAGSLGATGPDGPPGRAGEPGKQGADGVIEMTPNIGGVGTSQLRAFFGEFFDDYSEANSDADKANQNYTPLGEGPVHRRDLLESLRGSNNG